MRALKAILTRLGITTFNPPFRDFDTFYKHWCREGAVGGGGWQARRDILDEYFDPPEPPVASTKARLDRFIEVELAGSDNTELRKLARAAIEFAQAVKNRRATVSRTEAGIAADSVILLANILRRMQLSQ